MSGCDETVGCLYLNDILQRNKKHQQAKGFKTTAANKEVIKMQPSSQVRTAIPDTV
jgi:hypothetical protein